MTDPQDKHPDEQELSRRLRELPDTEADPGFRERLRADFVAGRLADDVEPTRTIQIPWGWITAAAAILLLAAVALLNPEPAVRIVATSGSGAVQIDGVEVPLSDEEAIDLALERGGTLFVPHEATLDLLVPEVMLYEVVGGTRMTLPESPGRWFNRTVSCSLLVGELRLKTGSRFAGVTMHVFTPDGRVEVTGTLLSVQCDPTGTCVCVLEGTARVGTNQADLEQVAPGYRKIMMKNGTVDIIPVKQMHKDGVLEFDRRAGHHVVEK